MARRDYRRKVSSKNTRDIDDFRDDIVAKFLGTTCFLVWSRIGTPAAITCVVILQPPDRSGVGSLVPFQDRLRVKFKNAQSRPWGKRIQFKVMDLKGFKGEYPQYPAKRL